MSFWTDDRIDELHRLAAAGMSATQIALAMGAPTRNVIIGKASQIGVSLGNSFWSKSRIDQLKRETQEGKTAREIGAALGCSKQAVIEKCKRHGIKLRHKRGCPVERRVAPKPIPALVEIAPRVSRQPRRAAAPVKAIAFEPPTNDNVALPVIRAHQCRWPMGDPRDVEGFRFCGATATLTYCPYHYGLAYRAGPNGSQRERRQMALAAE